MRYIAELQQMEESTGRPAPQHPSAPPAASRPTDLSDFAAERPVSPPSEPTLDQPLQRPEDMTAERYAALANWAESADTVTMSAVTEERFQPAADAEPPSVEAGRWAAGAEPPSMPVSHVAPGGAGRSRRIRVAVLAGAVLALLGGAATVVWGGDDEPAAPTAAVTTPAGVQPEARELPPADPLEPSETGTPTTVAPSAAQISPGTSATPSPPGLPRRVGAGLDVGRATPTPDRTLNPARPVYTAYFGYQADPDTGYTGTVQVINDGDGPGADWAVTLTVPGAEEVAVTSGDVRMSQSGSRVTFEPPNGTELGPGESLTIGFAIDGVPGELPTGCTVNGVACL